jgi:hypothetical protein
MQYAVVPLSLLDLHAGEREARRGSLKRNFRMRRGLTQRGSGLSRHAGAGSSQRFCSARGPEVRHHATQTHQAPTLSFRHSGEADVGCLLMCVICNM